MNRVILLVTLGLLSLTANAHDDHIGPMNGYVKHLGAAEVELVTTDAGIVVHVRDEKTGKAISLPSGSTGRAVVLSAGKTESVTLAPANGVLTGTAKAAIPANAKVALSLTIPGVEGIPSTTFDLGKKSTLPKGLPQ
ncbi:MAG: hypothetical protein AMXMBFR37_06950 [Steroidobacteraceae bacterium]|jgi:hypothetical protein